MSLLQTVINSVLRFSVRGLLGSLLLLSSSLGQQAARRPQPSSRPSQRSGKLSAGEIAGGVYRNSLLGFSYKIPFGWVDRTAVMEHSDASEQTPQASNAQVLLGVFERPPEAPRDAINSGVVIAAESAASYPGLKQAADYFGPLEQVTTSKGFKVVNEPYQFSIGEKSIPREDFSKEAGEMTMHQTCLVILKGGHIVSFTFISDSDEAIDELLAALSFQRSPASEHTPRANSHK